MFNIELGSAQLTMGEFVSFNVHMAGTPLPALCPPPEPGARAADAAPPAPRPSHVGPGALAAGVVPRSETLILAQ